MAGERGTGGSVFILRLLGGERVADASEEASVRAGTVALYCEYDEVVRGCTSASGEGLKTGMVCTSGTSASLDMTSVSLLLRGTKSSTLEKRMPICTVAVEPTDELRL